MTHAFTGSSLSLCPLEKPSKSLPWTSLPYPELLPSPKLFMANVDIICLSSLWAYAACGQKHRSFWWQSPWMSPL